MACSHNSHVRSNWKSLWAISHFVCSWIGEDRECGVTWQQLHTHTLKEHHSLGSTSSSLASSSWYHRGHWPMKGSCLQTQGHNAQVPGVEQGLCARGASTWHNEGVLSVLDPDKHQDRPADKWGTWPGSQGESSGSGAHGFRVWRQGALAGSPLWGHQTQHSNRNGLLQSLLLRNSQRHLPNIWIRSNRILRSISGWCSFKWTLQIM